MSRLSRFLARLPLLLFLAHAYVAIRLVGIPASGWEWLGILAMLACYAAVMTGFALRRSAGTPRGDLLAWLGFLALGLFSWLFVLTLARDAALLLWQAIAYTGLWPHASAAWLAATRAAIPLAGVAATVWGLRQARRTARVKTVRIELPGLPAGLDGLCIVQLSDLHIGPTIKHDYLQRIVDAVNAQDADIVAITGDVVDGSVPALREHTSPLGKLHARHGAYLVTGNHEYYAGAEAWVGEFRRLGLHVLMNEHRVIEHGGARLVLAGVNDYGAAAFDRAQASDPARAVAGAPAGAPRVLLAHQPRSAQAAEPVGFDLMLSGHTHGGQFVPWNFFVPLQQPVVAGLHRVGGLLVYVSRGTGYWGPPMRVGAPSEITRIELRRAG
ncbi:metallophosphoesterase [Verticiella sediminum]|uniref:Metallophosphoesterase n=1 Tax=Verticiella sediminum TaxID=1247510 RepID=A0A556B026_9BURK|nr:metallophosphoesterase [Verticiella sediminum]TSH98524.1 metallophosphoesterase [Verticiella sediminum]